MPLDYEAYNRALAGMYKALCKNEGIGWFIQRGTRCYVSYLIDNKYTDKEIKKKVKIAIEKYGKGKQNKWRVIKPIKDVINSLRKQKEDEEEKKEREKIASGYYNLCGERWRTDD